jgi:uncharacterized protein (DUF58 family)
LTSRGRFALGLGVATYVCAWAFGSKPLYPVAVGLLLAVAVTWAWVGLANRPMRLHRRLPGGDHAEGDDVLVRIELDRAGGLSPGSLMLQEKISKIGERHTPIHGRKAAYRLQNLSRGRYVFERATAVVQDPLGFQRVEVDLPTAGAVLVYPRLVELERLFSESGTTMLDGRRLLLRRPSGFDLHGVREYVDGESLRRVHWPSTARRGELMVKELEDAPRDEVAVVLDCNERVVVGTAPDSSFELQVRAAGSILRAHARRGRRALLVLNSLGRETQRVHTYEGDWRGALELLASVEPGPTAPAASLLTESGPAARSLEVAVVTSSLEPALVDRLLQRSFTRHSVSIVYVDPVSFAPGNGVPQPQPALLRLQAAGVPVAIVRRGDDLAAVLAPRQAAEAARA